MGFEDAAVLPKMIDGVYESNQGFNYTYATQYELKYFDPTYVQSKRIWMEAHWYFSIWTALIYVVLVFAGQRFMVNRPKYDLRFFLIAWNIFLAVFSIIGTVRSLPEFIDGLYRHGVEHSVCNSDYVYGVSGCWAWLFIISKVPELVDTLFIVLRKQELIFLHWYHHCTVLVYCWYAAHDFSSTGRWFVNMNYTVHAAMYSYYACRAMRLRIPKFVNIAITTGQISQMVIGIYVNLHAYEAKGAGRSCNVSYENIKVSFLMYFSYFLLFFHFFYTTYITPKPTTTKSTSASKKEHAHKNGNGHALHQQNGNVANGNGISIHNDKNNNEEKKHA